MDENWIGLPPREKLLTSGVQALSDVELLAIFLRIGARGIHVMTLAQRLLDTFGSLHALMTAPLDDFQAIHGIGVAKYAQLNAVAELARRCFTCVQALENRAISSAEQMLDFLNSSLAHQEREIFLVIFFDNQHRIIHTSEMFSGTINSVEVHPREIVREALKTQCCSVDSGT